MSKVWMKAFLIIFCAIGFSKSIAAAPSAFDFSAPSRFTSVELSPTGKYLAFVIVDTNKHCIMFNGQMEVPEKSNCSEAEKKYGNTYKINIFDLHTSKVITTIPVAQNFSIGWLEWVSDDRLLASLESPFTFANKGHRYMPSESRIVSFSRTGGNFTTLFSGQEGVTKENRHISQVANMLRSDPNHIIMPATDGDKNNLWKVNVVSGKASLIERGKTLTLHWFTDIQGDPVLRFDCNSYRCSRIKVFSKASSGKWNKIKTLKSKPDEGLEDLEFWPVGVTDTPGQYYVLSGEDQEGTRSLKIFDLETSQYIKTVFEHSKYDVGGILQDLQTGDYAGAFYIEDRLTYALIDNEQQQHIDGINKYFKNLENVQMRGFTADKSKLLIYVSGPNNAGEYFLYNLKGRHVEPLFRRNDKLPDRLNTKTDIISIPTRDGKEVTSYHTYNITKPIAQQPLLVMPHGGPEIRDEFTFDRWVQYFASRGYQILQVNFRGSSGYGRAFAEEGYGEWGGVMQNDVTDAVKYLFAKGSATAARTCIVGYSYGGYVALFGGASTSELYSCVVSGGGVADIKDSLDRTRKLYGPNSGSFEYWEKSMGDSQKDKKALEAISPVDLAADFQAPVLLLHGEYDRIVSVEQSQDMAEALRKAGKNVEYVELTGAGHSNWSLENNILYLETIEGFLSKHLP